MKISVQINRYDKVTKSTLAYTETIINNDIDAIRQELMGTFEEHYDSVMTGMSEAKITASGTDEFILNRVFDSSDDTMVLTYSVTAYARRKEDLEKLFSISSVESESITPTSDVNTSTITATTDGSIDSSSTNTVHIELKQEEQEEPKQDEKEEVSKEQREESRKSKKQLELESYYQAGNTYTVDNNTAMYVLSDGNDFKSITCPILPSDEFNIKCSNIRPNVKYVKSDIDFFDLTRWNTSDFFIDFKEMISY